MKHRDDAPQTRTVAARMPAVRVRFVGAESIDERTRRAWIDLEARAIEPNAYLSPLFVFPALRHLNPEVRAIIALIERVAAGSSELVGVGVFRHKHASRRCPLPHLSAYRSPHTFVSGLLVDRAYVDETISALMVEVRARRWNWSAVEIGKTWADGPLAEALNANLRGMEAKHWLHARVERAVLNLGTPGEQHFAALPGSRRQDLLRRMRRLAERGTVSWRASGREGLPVDCVDTFLDLEHLGWKGCAGSSLRAHRRNEAFFREMIAGFAREGRVLFTELAVDDQVIASTSNLISGNAGFAFKVGWNPEFASFSPGRLVEVEFLRRADAVCGDLSFFDSGAGPGSYMEDLWLGRRIMASTLVATNALGASAISMIERVRALRHQAPLVGALALEAWLESDLPALLTDGLLPTGPLGL